MIMQNDITSLQLAKDAISAGIKILIIYLKSLLNLFKNVVYNLPFLYTKIMDIDLFFIQIHIHSPPNVLKNNDYI
jgi:hypothetical protein